MIFEKISPDTKIQDITFPTKKPIEKISLESISQNEITYIGRFVQVKKKNLRGLKKIS